MLAVVLATTGGLQRGRPSRRTRGLFASPLDEDARWRSLKVPGGSPVRSRPLACTLQCCSAPAPARQRQRVEREDWHAQVKGTDWLAQPCGPRGPYSQTEARCEGRAGLDGRCACKARALRELLASLPGWLRLPFESRGSGGRRLIQSLACWRAAHGALRGLLGGVCADRRSEA